MLALLSVWIALASLVLAVAMAVHRPAFTDLSVWLVLWLGAPGAMCLAGMVLWSYRKDVVAGRGVRAQRMQCKVAIAMALVGAAIVYVLVIGAEEIPGGLPGVSGSINISTGGD
ncbi:MAG: hypothetical protein HOP29_01725 [Phycisphaerales bacterium]|nr:hypothetical protein [Phycisphaerales bacterium]